MKKAKNVVLIFSLLLNLIFIITRNDASVEKVVLEDVPTENTVKDIFTDDSVKKPVPEVLINFLENDSVK